MILLFASAFAAGLTLAPSDGVRPLGPRQPAWALFAASPPERTPFEARARELNLAWEERRALDNVAAGRRVDALVRHLRPVLDAGERDLLQRALFLRGVLEIDEAGDVAQLTRGLDVEGTRIPHAWADAISSSPGAAAPANADAAFAVHLYEQARTALVARGGLSLDPSAPGAGEVRVDGLPVTQEIVLLPGAHTLSWHPVGSDPLVLELGDTKFDPKELQAWLDGLARVEQGDGALDPAARSRLHAALKSPAVSLAAARPGRIVWLVDGAARWGKPMFNVGLTAGGWGFASGEAPSVACDGAVSAPNEGLALGGIEVAATVGPTRLRVGGGAVRALGGGFPVVAEGTCPTGVTPNTEFVATLPWAWASAGRRFGLSRTRELEPFVRVGGTSAYALVQLGLGVRFDTGALTVEVRGAAGPAINAWSGEPRFGFLGGIETALSFGGG